MVISVVAMIFYGLIDQIPRDHLAVCRFHVVDLSFAKDVKVLGGDFVVSDLFQCSFDLFVHDHKTILGPLSVQILGIGHRTSVCGVADVVKPVDVGTEGCHTRNSLFDTLASGSQMLCCLKSARLRSGSACSTYQEYHLE